MTQTPYEEARTELERILKLFPEDSLPDTLHIYTDHARALLSPPEPTEPVAWRYRYISGLSGVTDRWTYRSTPISPCPASPGEKAREVQPLYASPVPTEPTEEDRMAAEKAFRVWYFEHTGKRLFATNALKAVDVVIQSLFRSRRDGR